MPIIYPIPIPVSGDDKIPVGAAVILIVLFVAVVAFMIWALIDMRK